MKQLFIIIMCIVGLLLTGEIVLRVIYSRVGAPEGWSNTQEFELDRNLIYRGIRNGSYTVSTDEYKEQVTTNSQGFRDEEIKPKKIDVFRIIVVGDSFSFGHGVSTNSNTYPALLEKKLINHTQNPNIEVINMAVKGYSPDQEYRLITSVVFRLKPDMIIWSLSNPGDMYNLTFMPGWQSPWLYRLSQNKLIPYDGRANWMYVARWIKMNTHPRVNSSYLFNFTVYWISQIPIVSNKPSHKYEELIPQATAKLTTQILDIQKKSSVHRIRFVVAVLPYPDIFAKREGTAVGVVSTAHMKAFNDVLNSVQKENIPIVNGEDVLSNDKTIAWRSLYFKKDYHPNDTGAALFASFIADRILNFIPLH